MNHTRTNPRRRGATIVESIIALTLFTVAIGMGGMMMSGAQGAYRQVSTTIHETTELRRQSERLADELASISPSMMYPYPEGDWGSNFLSYHQVEGIEKGEVVWGPRNVLFLAYDTGEDGDGIDNDGDGFVDECRVMLARDVDSADMVMVTLFDDVPLYATGEDPNGYDDNGNGLIDENGLSFHVEDGVLTIRLGSQSLDEGHQLVQHTAQRSLRLMN